jgi:DNA-binding SARP family transcriptional activator/class 3 adenylate cyclase
MEEIELRLLGSPTIHVAGEERRLTRRKSLALLAVVAASRNGRLSRDQIIGLLWPEQDDTHARASLRTTLSVLNTETGRAVATSEGDLVILVPEVWVDVTTYEGLAEGTRDLFDATAIQTLSEAANLYRGDFLAGFFAGKGSIEFEDWQFNRQSAYRKMQSGVLERLVQAFTLEGNYSGATGFAERWTAHEPENENAHRRLIELYAWSGRRSDALHQYELCVAYLKRELDVEPEEATRQLCLSIRENRLKAPEPMGDGEGFSPADPVAGSLVFFSTVLSVGLANAGDKLWEQRPYDMASIVNILFHQSIEKVLKQHSVDAWLFAGDSLVAVFGVPNVLEDDAYHAVIAALQILQICADYGFSMTAGLSTDLLYSRSDEGGARNSSLIGPAVTRADLLRFFGDPGGIFLDQKTRDGVRDSISLHSVDRGIPGLGRSEPVWRVDMGSIRAAELYRT